MSLRIKCFVVWLVVCLLTSLTVTMVAPARAATSSESVSSAQERLSAAGKKVATAKDEAAEAEKRVAAAKASLNAVKDQLRVARQEAGRANQKTISTASEASRTGELANGADAIAFGARAAVMRLARNAYVSAVATSDLMMLTDFFTDGSASLGDFSQQLLATDRVQDRLLQEAQATAVVAEETRSTAVNAARDHESAVDWQRTADEVALKFRRDLKSATKAIAVEQRESRKTRTTLRRAEANYLKAQDSFKQAFLSACTSGGSSAAPSAPPASSGNQAKAVWDTLLANGFSQEAAAGILGNLQQESNVDPTTMQNGGPGMGLAQWSRGGRWDNGPRSMLSFAGTRGMDPWEASTQIQFMIYEMSDAWGGFNLESFRNMTDIAQATVYFHDVFERSADSGAFVNTIRVGYSQMWYAQLSTGSSKSGSTSGVPVVLTCPNE